MFDFGVIMQGARFCVAYPDAAEDQDSLTTSGRDEPGIARQPNRAAPLSAGNKHGSQNGCPAQSIGLALGLHQGLTRRTQQGNFSPNVDRGHKSLGQVRPKYRTWTCHAEMGESVRKKRLRERSSET